MNTRNGGLLNCDDSELCTYLRALEEGFLPTYYSNTSQCAPLKLMDIASRSYQVGKKTVYFHGFQSLEMCQNSTENRGEESSKSSAVDFHARTSALPEKALESTENDPDSGERWPASLAKFDPISFSWKTHQCSLHGGLEEFSETWPSWGIMRDGECWALDTPEPRTKEIASGLWPTPSGTSNHGKNHVVGRLDEWGGSSNRFRGTNLQRVRCATFEEWMMGWPTGWSALTALETDKFQQWRRSHGKP